MHTIKTQSVFIRPEQYKDCMDLSLMLAWNAQCTFGEKQELKTQKEIYKVDKLRGAGQGTGDALWKVAAKERTKKVFDGYEKDKRIARLNSEISSIKQANTPARQAPHPAPTPRFPRTNALGTPDVPVAALLPHRVGSPGADGVRKQFARYEAEYSRICGERGGPAAGSAGFAVPPGFHNAPTKTIAESHKHQSLRRSENQHYLDTPAAVDHREMKEFTASWRPPVTQRRVHSIRDLA